MRSSHALMHMLVHVSPLSLILQWVGRIIPNVRRDLFWSACFLVNILHMSQCRNTNRPWWPESLCCCTGSESASSPSTLIWFWEVFDSLVICLCLFNGLKHPTSSFKLFGVAFFFLDFPSPCVEQLKTNPVITGNKWKIHSSKCDFVRYHYLCFSVSCTQNQTQWEWCLICEKKCILWTGSF